LGSITKNSTLPVLLLEDSNDSFMTFNINPFETYNDDVNDNFILKYSQRKDKITLHIETENCNSNFDVDQFLNLHSSDATTISSDTSRSSGNSGDPRQPNNVKEVINLSNFKDHVSTSIANANYKDDEEISYLINNTSSSSSEEEILYNLEKVQKWYENVEIQNTNHVQEIEIEGSSNVHNNNDLQIKSNNAPQQITINSNLFEPISPYEPISTANSSSNIDHHTDDNDDYDDDDGGGGGGVQAFDSRKYNYLTMFIPVSKLNNHVYFLMSEARRTKNIFIFNMNLTTACQQSSTQHSVSTVDSTVTKHWLLSTEY
jgi:hypothetical protein